MFQFNIFDIAEPLDLILCRPNEKPLCVLNGIEEDTASLTINLNNQYELSFDYSKYVDIDGELIKSNGYNKLSSGMKILIPSIGYFRMEHPVLNFDGWKTFKSITAYSIDCELEDKDLNNCKMNTGEEISYEYLVTYEDGETEQLLNEYTGLPYDYIVFYNTFPEQLAKIKNKYSDGIYTDSAIISEIKEFCDLIPRLKNRVITTEDSSSIEEYVIYTYDSSGQNIISVELLNFNSRVNKLIDFYIKYRDQLSLVSLVLKTCKCDWEVGEIDPSLVNKKFRFDVDSTNVYNFFTQDVTTAAECIFEFDLFRKKVNVKLIENIGKDSNVIIGYSNLLDTLKVSCEDSHLYTRYNVSGADGLGLEYVNFGSNQITDLTYKMKARDDDGDLIYVTEELADKYSQYTADREIAREKYIDLTKSYNQLLIDIDKLKYKLPDDVVDTPWETYTSEELDAAEISYTNLLNTLLTLYKEDYGEAGCNFDGSVKESVIKASVYWNDYYSYNQALKQIREAKVALQNGSNYNKIDNKDVLDKINAYKTEWSLYGTVELQNKIDAYNEQLKAWVQKDSLVLYSNSETAKPWTNLTSNEKIVYGNVDSPYTENYTEYMRVLNERNACQAYLDTLLSQLSEKESQLQTYQDQRSEIAKLVSVEGYDRAKLNKIVSLENPTTGNKFAGDEIKNINLLYVDNSYSNENILTTSLDDIVTTIDIQRDLLEDAKEKLSIASQPQMIFNVGIDNLLCMPEFKDYEFIPGNYVYVEYQEDYYAKLRLFSLKFNPCIPTDTPDVTFTNFVSSNAKRNDLSFILGQSSGSGKSSSGSSGGSGSGSFGTGDGIDITISNTMLSKMLNTELFATRVSDVVLDNLKVNVINGKYAQFDGLANGTTTIDGGCVRTGAILSNNYNGTITTNSVSGIKTYALNNTTGSILKLDDGTFSFAGGRLVFDGNKLTFGSDVTLSWSQVTGTENIASTSDIPTKVSQLLNDNGYQNSSQVTTITKNTVTTSYVNALAITAKAVQSDWVYAGNVKAGQIKTGSLVSTDGSTTVINLDNGQFSFGGGKLAWNGSILSVNGNITTSNLQATGGIIGGWTITSTDLYNTDAGMSSNTGKYAFWAGESNSVHGASNSNAAFKVGHNGALVATNANIQGTITATAGTIAGFTISGDRIFNSNGWSIGPNKMYATGTDGYTVEVQKYISGENKWVFAAGGKNHDSYADCPFRVRYDGILYAEQLRVKQDYRLYVETPNETENDLDGKTIKVISAGQWDSNYRVIDFGFGGGNHVIRFSRPQSSASGTNLDIGYSSGFQQISMNASYGYININDLTLSGKLSITSNLSVGNNITVAGNITANGDYLYVKNPLTKDTTFSVLNGVVKSRDWNSTLRTPIGSDETDGERISYIGSHTNTSGTYYITVGGQWSGKAGESFAGHNIYANTSDIRLKTNISNTKITALPVIKQIKVRQFDWKQTNIHQDIGVVADELEKLDSNFTVGGGYNTDGSINIKSVNTFHLTTYLIKAVQELSNEVSSLKQQIKK